jgi:predicted XRE-type DNA-binding protein
MKKCEQKLKELITNVVILDIENHIDDIFESIANTKNATDESRDELAQMHEMKEEFTQILEDIENNTLMQEECIELYNEINSMISANEE